MLVRYKPAAARLGTSRRLEDLVASRLQAGALGPDVLQLLGGGSPVR